MAGSPGDDEGGGEEEAPGEDPDEVEEPVGDPRQAVVVVGIAEAAEAEDVFVEEVEVPEAVDVAEGGDVTDGMALVGVAQTGEDVPRGGDEEEEEESGDGLEATPATPLAAEQEQWGMTAAKKKTGAMRPLVSVARASAAQAR